MITTVGYAYDALSRRIAKTLTGPDGHVRITRYGWDGERLVCEDDGERTLTVLYEPGRFVPVLRIEQGREAPADEDEAVTQTALDQVARLCAAEGIELPKVLRSQAAARISLYVTDHLGTPCAWSGRRVPSSGRPGLTTGAPCVNNTVFANPSASRGSGRMRRVGSTTTDIDTMIRQWGATSRRTRLDYRAEVTSIVMPPPTPSI
uniref:hypothetical protein n=1 Tax=Thauera sp. SDU_THAU2 TaxID=3136633 RepID=UPI00311F3767